VTCAQLVELVSDYVEGALDDETAALFASHVAGCPPCATYLDQMRTSIQRTGRLREDAISADARDALLVAFRAWSRP
jgi:anti-sigma factor RsiW